MALNKKKYLVTGGAGFIGSQLARALIADGHQVRIVDNLSTGYQANLPPEADFIRADICQLEAIKPACQNIDGVFHCAALPRVQTSIEQPVETNNININGTLNVIMAAKEAGVR